MTSPYRYIGPNTATIGEGATVRQPNSTSGRGETLRLLSSSSCSGLGRFFSSPFKACSSNSSRRSWETLHVVRKRFGAENHAVKQSLAIPDSRVENGLDDTKNALKSEYLPLYLSPTSTTLEEKRERFAMKESFQEFFQTMVLRASSISILGGQKQSRIIVGRVWGFPHVWGHFHMAFYGGNFNCSSCIQLMVLLSLKWNTYSNNPS